MDTNLSGPCTCYRFWVLLQKAREATGEARRRAWFAFNKHVDDCPACQFWHAQPQPEID